MVDSNRKGIQSTRKLIANNPVNYLRCRLFEESGLDYLPIQTRYPLYPLRVYF